MLAHAGAVAYLHRGQDGAAGIDTCEQVGQRHAHALRAAAGRALGFAGDAHHAAHGLDHQVVTGALGVGPGLAEAGNGAVNQAWVEGAQAGLVQTIVRQAADLEVFHHDVALQRELPDQRLALLLGNVDGDGAFVAVAGGEVARLRGFLPLGIAQKGRAPVSRVVALAGFFDLDDISPQVGQHLGTPGAGKYTREVEDFEMGEGGGGLRHGQSGCQKR